MRGLMAVTGLLVGMPAMAASQGQEEPVAARPTASRPTAEISTGAEYQEGKYGTGQKIETTTIPTNLRISTGRWQLSATLPYVRIDAPGNVVGGGGGILGPILIDPTQPATRILREGMGDLKLGATYIVPTTAINLALSSQIKVPTASQRKGLGTGEVDYSAGAEISRRFGIVSPFIGVNYTLSGDPKGYDLRNSLSARGGIAAMLGSRVRGYVSYGYTQSPSHLVANEQQISTGINAGLTNRLSLGLFGTAGLSQGSPDVGAGVQLGVRLF
jgi:hypothetical protein